MENNFSSNDVRDFLKLLIEIGGVHYVDASNCVYRTEDRTPLGVKLGSGKNDKKIIALFKENERPPQNAVYLNPFVELIGKHPELDLFMSIISIVPGCLAMHTMVKMVELIRSNKTDTEFKTADLMSKYVDKVDDKFVNELQKIRPIDAGVIAYDSSKYTAQLQCLFWTDEWIDKVKSKLRKSSIKTIQEMAADLYGTDTPHSIMCTGTLPPCKRFDAVVHVLVEALDRLQKWVEPISGIELHVEELKMHLERLPAYHKAMQWLATTTASSDKANANKSEISKLISGQETPPWSTSTSTLAAKVSAVTPGGMDFLKNVSTVGVTKNPTYAGAAPVMNPSFGGGAFGVSPITPGIPGMGMSVSPVVPTINNAGNFIADAASVGFGSVGGGFSTMFY